jgi:hypothetical protein
MARNQRIFYACQAVVIAPRGTTTLTDSHVAHGVQSVGMTSSFTLDQVFELGQIEIYENIEEVADVEVTIEKVIDGDKLIYDLATNGACKTGVVPASKARSDVYVGIFDDGLNQATGVPRNICMNSGMFVSSVSYSYSVDSSATESVTLVGNDRFWNDYAGVTAAPDTVWSDTDLLGPGGGSTNPIDGGDIPKSGVVRRVNCDITSSAIPAVVKAQGGDDTAVEAGISDNAHIQSISVSTDFGQENIQELGRFGPYTRYATFPIEVTCDFEVIATSGDLINVSGAAPNLTNETIRIQDTAGTVLDLGSKNKLSSVSYSGGDTGGGNATVTFSYSNFNVLTVDGGSLGPAPGE